MPRKIPGVTRQDLVNATLPPATKTYTVISHNFVITNVLQMLSANGFEVKEEVYRCTKDAQVASGIYRINYEDDPDLGMMFAFGNSYDKSMRFKCAVGAYIYANQSSMINKMSDWNRKHTGTADAETQETIEDQVNNAMVYYNELREQKNLMKDIEADPLVFGKLLGELYFNLKLLTGEQMAIIKREYERPSFTYTTGKNNLWTLYNHILVALKISHPRTWMEQQTAINYKIAMDFNLIEFDEDETTDEKVSNVSSAGTGNAGMFLPGFGKSQTNEFNPNDNEIKPIHEILELDAAAEDVFANEPVMGITKEITAEELIEEYGQDLSEVDSITIQNDMTADEALETYPEMSKEIVEAAGVTEEFVEEVVITERPAEPEEYAAIQEIANVVIVEATEEDATEMLYGVDNSGGLEMTDGLLPLVEEEVEEEVYVEVVDVLDSEIPWVTDEEEDAIMETMYTEVPVLDEPLIPTQEELDAEHVGPPEMYQEEAPTFDNTTVDDQEELPIESTDEVFDIEEVIPGIQPVVGLDEPVQIMSPAEAKEKSELIDTPDKTSDLYITIKLELLELYGYTPDFTYTEKDNQYNVVLESGETVVLSAAYIDSLNN